MTSTRPTSLESRQERTQRAFSETADPAAYVPRAATETVISRIQSWVAEVGPGSTVAALIAQPGLGKTFLLRLFESRLAGGHEPSHGAGRDRVQSGRRALYLPYAGLSIIDLCVWIYGLLGRAIELPKATDDPAAALAPLLDLAGGPNEEPFILLLDDADSMPAETIRTLARGLPRENSPLRILMALNDDAKASRLLAALDPLSPRLVPLQQPMSEAETALYLRARMQWAGLDADEIGRLDQDLVGRIQALSAGVPRRVHMVAASYFDSGNMGLPRELDDKARRENWMGQPIEDDF